MQRTGLVACELLGRSSTPPTVSFACAVDTMLAPPESSQPVEPSESKLPPGASVYQLKSLSAVNGCVSVGSAQVARAATVVGVATVAADADVANAAVPTAVRHNKPARRTERDEYMY